VSRYHLYLKPGNSSKKYSKSKPKTLCELID